jgi:uncharacterized membrane protein YoaK (UPF0700 family)
MNDNANSQENVLLECEKLWIFAILIMSGGFLGAYTYSLRGGIFCNAQTANVVLMGMALGSGQWMKALYYLIPIGAYTLGAVISELLPNPVKRMRILRWDTFLVGLECIVTFILGFIPDSWPYQICQVTINFICSMQYNTFRQADHIPMATTFCTNHIRQIGVHLTKWLRHKDLAARHRMLVHLLMLFSFAVGATVSTVSCSMIGGKAIWGASVLLLIIFADLARADLTTEKELMHLKPSGH